MIRLGLTGGIATGKSTVSQQFALLGAKLYDADQAVHELLRRNGEVRQWVEQRFPDAVREGWIDRKILGGIVFNDASALRELEAAMHPAVAAWEERVAMRHQRNGAWLMVSDIPLLYEVRAQNRYHATALVSCPDFIQRQRAMRRSGMTETKYAHILTRQMRTVEKRRHADFEIFTGLGRGFSMAAVKELVAGL